MASSSPIAEYDLVSPLHEVSAEVIGEGRQVLIPPGTLGTVVMVHVVQGEAAAYEVEFAFSRRSAALATILVGKVKRIGASERPRSCPCCGYRTLQDSNPGSYEVCPVCFWEDDPIQSAKPNYKGGANRVSLQEAQANYASFGACERSALSHTRAPLPSEREAPE